MRCLFCKSESSNSKCVEHIIPESLGNKEHILKNGIVCDKCNQYFSIKIEKPLLEKPYFISVRHRNFIKNKKNSIPLERVFIGNDNKAYIDPNSEGRSLLLENPETINGIISGKITQMIVPMINSPEPHDRDLSRLLGKIAIESLAYKNASCLEWIEELVEKTELDELRNYVRIGNKPDFWEYSQRRLYQEHDRFEDLRTNEMGFEILHEFTFLYTEDYELYLILAIMGIEYAINLTNPKIEGYIDWLNKNNQKSPLSDPNEKLLNK